MIPKAKTAKALARPLPKPAAAKKARAVKRVNPFSIVVTGTTLLMRDLIAHLPDLTSEHSPKALTPHQGLTLAGEVAALHAGACSYRQQFMDWVNRDDRAHPDSRLHGMTVEAEHKLQRHLQQIAIANTKVSTIPLSHLPTRRQVTAYRKYFNAYNEAIAIYAAVVENDLKKGYRSWREAPKAKAL